MLSLTFAPGGSGTLSLPPDPFHYNIPVNPGTVAPSEKSKRNAIVLVYNIKM
jgi:hypothetical protein